MEHHLLPEAHTLSFANDIYTEEGGMHLEGFRTALTKAVNDYGKRQNIIKEKDPNLTGDDIREGLTAVVSVKLPDRSLRARPRPSSAAPTCARSPTAS